jgi:hypothetical protein
VIIKLITSHAQGIPPPTQAHHHDRKPSPRRSNTIAKSQVATRSDESCRFFIGVGNNGELVRRVLSTRSQWTETADGKELFINLRWQQSNKTYKYENCIDNRIFKHSLNHFEYHHELSNKEYLFHNLLEYCELHKINVFEFIPLTFVLNILDSNYESEQAQFLNFYHENKSKKEAGELSTLSLRRRRGNPNHLLPISKEIRSHFCKY